MSESIAVLAFGGVNGKFKLAFRKLQMIKTGIGHVDFAICVGDFFSTNCDESWHKVQLKELNAPVQIYILGPSSPELERFYNGHQEMSDLADNITYIGKSGVFNTLEGLKIAYLSGKLSTEETPSTYTYEHVKRLLSSTSNDRLDILATWSWPTGIGVIPISYRQENIKEEGLISSYLFSKTSPQYHFGGCERIGCDLSVERQLIDGSSAGTSRFVGLGSIEENKLLWIKGINMIPYSLTQRQENKRILALAEKEFQELTKKLYKENIYTVKNIRYDLKRPNRTDEASTSSKTKKSRENECWFCLSGLKIDKHLIVSLGTYCYLALDKGPVVNDHLLIIPIQHLPSMKGVTDQHFIKEIARFKQALIEFFKPNAKPVFFERSSRTLHFQINCIPVPVDKVSILPTIFKNLAKKYDLNFNEYFDHKFKFEDHAENYFHVDLNDGHELLITGSDINNIPLTFGREAITSKEILNIPEKMIWQKCRMTKEDELKVVSLLKKKFSPFDFTD